MSTRYTTLDIIVGIGLCAIIFGAFVFFGAADGTLQATLQPIPIETSGFPADMASVQPALGQAIVDEVVLERRTDRAIAQATFESNWATLAHDDLQALPGGPFGVVMRYAATAPREHAARVQSVMGRAIVNFTARGIRSGAMSADQSLSDFNATMIRATEARGQRLDQEFASTWQETLGRRIVDASQDYTRRDEAIQERLGTAILHLTQAQTRSDDARAENQYQLASLMTAAMNTDALADRAARLAAAELKHEGGTVASTEAASWPEIPIGYLIAATLGLAAIFFGGLSLSARIRESKALAEMKRHAARWVYRTAA